MSLILIADTLLGAPSLKRILEGHKLVIVHTMNDAQGELEGQDFELAIVGLQFDESRMFEFIKAVKTTPRNSTRPIICFCARETEIARIMQESLEVSTRALGAWMYLSEHAYNVFKSPDAELRRVIERCLTGEARLDIQEKRINIQHRREELQQLRIMLETQQWSVEMQEYLIGLKCDLELLLKQVASLRSLADNERAKVTASRDLKDRVSDEVTKLENSMTVREQLQAASETKQSADEDKLAGEEEVKMSTASSPKDG